MYKKVQPARFFIFMILLYTLIAIYLLGYGLAYAMMRVEYEAEGEIYTKGDRALNFTLALLSWAVILYMLVSAWINKVRATGYWSRPAKPLKPELIERTQSL